MVEIQVLSPLLPIPGMQVPWLYRSQCYLLAEGPGLQYADIDTSASYTVKVNGVGECLLKINGQRVAPSHYGREVGDIKEFPVPAELIRSGNLLLTWDDINEEFLNWRKQSRVSEVWLIKETDSEMAHTH